MHGGRALGRGGGPRPRRLHRWRARRRAARRLPRRPDRCCTATTSRSPSWRPRSTPASAGSSSTPSTRSSGWPALRRRARCDRAGAGARHRRRRGAHPRVHRDRARGPEVRLLAGRRRRARGGPPGARRAGGSSSSGCTRTSARRSSTPSGFEVAAHRVVGLLARCATSTASSCAELNLGGGLGIAYTSADDPADVAEMAASLRDIVEPRVRGARARRAAAGDRAGPRHRRARHDHGLRGRHRQGRSTGLRTLRRRSTAA